MVKKIPDNLFERLNNNRFLRFYLLIRLPLAFLAGVRMLTFQRESCTTSMRYKWITRNPFNSMYFAAMHMGAELACGLLIFAHISDRKAKVSMLLQEQSSNFGIQAKGKVLFICQQGDEIAEAVRVANESEEAHKIDVKVYATDEIGTILATFMFKWSLKKMK